MGPRSDSSPPLASPQATLFLMQLPDLPLVSACPSSHLTASVYPGPSVILTLSDPNSSGLLSSRSARAYTFRSPQSLSIALPYTRPLAVLPSPSVRAAKNSSPSAGSRSKASGTITCPGSYHPHPQTQIVCLPLSNPQTFP